MAPLDGHESNINETFNKTIIAMMLSDKQDSAFHFHCPNQLMIFIWTGFVKLKKAVIRRASSVVNNCNRLNSHNIQPIFTTLVQDNYRNDYWSSWMDKVNS